MKGHKAHRHEAGKRRAEGGQVESGTKEWEQDLGEKPEARTNAKKIDKEAEERKHGGRAKRKHGGHVTHHEAGKPLGHAKHVGLVHGRAAEHHAGRKPRKAGGRGSNDSPLSSAHAGSHPGAHHDVEID